MSSGIGESGFALTAIPAHPHSHADSLLPGLPRSLQELFADLQPGDFTPLKSFHQRIPIRPSGGATLSRPDPAKSARPGGSLQDVARDYAFFLSGLGLAQPL